MKNMIIKTILLNGIPISDEKTEELMKKYIFDNGEILSLEKYGSYDMCRYNRGISEITDTGARAIQHMHNMQILHQFLDGTKIITYEGVLQVQLEEKHYTKEEKTTWEAKIFGDIPII